MRVIRILGLTMLWLVTALAAVTLAKAGYGKFADAVGWYYWFGKWGFPPWFATVTGVIELGGAILLLVPRIAPYSAALLITVMVGALYTVTTKETNLSPVDPIINTVLLGIVFVARLSLSWRRSASQQDHKRTI